MEPTSPRPISNPPAGAGATHPTAAKPPAMAGTATVSAHTLTTDVKDLASDVAGRARQLVSDELVERQHSGADQLAKVADALRKADLKDTLVEPYREKAANVVERLSDSVRDAELADVTQATERFARRAPLQFVGGALALGFAAGRFLRSSARRRSSRMGVGAGGANDGGH